MNRLNIFSKLSKIKKFKFSTLVALFLMIMTIIPMTMVVSAADSPLIDNSMDGKASLTVTKYEMDDISTATHIGYGEPEKKKSEGGYIPDEAKAFKDVTFKITRIAQLTNYYKTNGISLPTVSEAKEMAKTGDEIKSVKTNSDGVAKFTNLKLGIYLVEETGHPTQVTKKSAPFVISVPTTSSTCDKWFYDIYAYPKNETKYADVKLIKMDTIGNVPLKDVVFTLEESIDNQKSWTPVNSTAGNNHYKTNNKGEFTWEHLPSQRYYKVKEYSVPDKKYILNNKAEYIFYINGLGQLEMNGKVDTTGKNEFTVNNDYVVPEKYILNTNGKIDADYSNTSDAINEDSSLRGKDSPANMGDTVSWLMEANVPEEIADMATYSLVDTMGEGLSYKSSSVYGVKGNKATALTVNTDYKVSESGRKVTFALTKAGIKKVATNGYEKICIYFNTILTSQANLGEDIHNKVEAVYSNNLNDDTSTVTTTPDDPDGPETHTSGFQFKKVTNKDAALAGAKFKLFATEQDAKNLTNALSFYTYDASGNKVKATEAVSDANGLVSFLGLKYGEFKDNEQTGSTDYWVVETETASGYNLLKEPIKITVKQNTYDFANTGMKVVNTPKIPAPQTGVMTTIATTGIGFILIGIGFFVFAKKKRKTNN